MISHKPKYFQVERIVIPPTKIYVGNLPFGIKVSDIQTLFKRFGQVQALELKTDPQKFENPHCVVTMESMPAIKAILALHGTEFQGQNINVWESTIRESKRKTGSS